MNDTLFFFLRSMLPAALPAVVIGALNSRAVIAGYSKWRNVSVDAAEGRTTTSPHVLCLCAVFALATVGLFLLAPPLTPMNFAFLLLLGASLTLCAWTGVLMFDTWTWNNTTLSQRGLFGAKSVNWADLTEVDRYRSQRTVLKTRDGHKVEWSCWTMHGQKLAEALAHARPDIKINERYW